MWNIFKESHLRYPFFNSDELLVLLELLVPVKRLMLIIEEKYD